LVSHKFPINSVGVFRHVVHDSKKFEDEYLFFRFTDYSKKEESIKNVLIHNFEDSIRIRSIMLNPNAILDFYREFTDPEKGIDIRDREYRWKTYEVCFLSVLAAVWISEHFSISKQAAVEIGDFFRRIGMYEHVTDQNKPFQDGLFFFQITNFSSFKSNLSKVHSDICKNDPDLGFFLFDVGLSEEQKLKIKKTQVGLLFD
jgi:hypothetical protein